MPGGRVRVSSNEKAPPEMPFQTGFSTTRLSAIKKDKPISKGDRAVEHIIMRCSSAYRWYILLPLCSAFLRASWQVR